MQKLIDSGKTEDALVMMFREEQKFVFDPTVYGKITIPTLQQHAAMYTSPDLFVKELRNPYARSTDIMPVRNIASNVPAPPIETTGTPR